jgi:HK97 family phage portal protein
MLERLKNYFKGSVWQTVKTQVLPVGRGIRYTVDAGGNMIFATCIEILAKNLAQNKWAIYGADHKEQANLMATFRKALNLSPYPGINAYDFWAYMEKQRQGGNAYAYIKTNNLGVEYLVPLDNTQMKVFWDDANILDGARKIIYQYTDQVAGQTFTILPEELLHFKAYSLNGIVGRPALTVLGETLKSDADVESALRTGVANGFDGTIILSYTSDLSKTKQDELQARVKELLQNSNSTILPLPAGMSATNIKNDVKAYFDSLKTYNAQAISSFFGIPLAMLNIGGGAGMATFSTNQLMSFYTGTIAPIISQYAAELTTKLLTERQIGKGYRFDTANDVFDMLDAQAKSSVLCSYTGAGILTANEARASLQYPALEGGDVLTQRGGTGSLGDTPTNEGGRGKEEANGI